MNPSPCIRFASLVLLGATWIADPGAARAEGAATEVECAAPPAPEAPEPDAVLLRLPAWERAHDRLDAWRERHPVQISFGAEHWWRMDRETEDVTYGYPGGGEGTYGWWLQVHVEAPVAPGSDRSFGAHLELSWRERTKFASFYDSRLWLQQAYVFTDVWGGRLSAGKIYRALGLEDDSTWWGSIPYYDGFMSDPDWGVSFTRSPRDGARFALGFTAQAFFAEDNVNGSAPGGDAESDPTRREAFSGLVRLAPVWTFAEDRTLSVGLSAASGRQVGRGAADESVTEVAVDATLVLGRLKLAAGAYLADGVRHAANYVTGDRVDSVTDVVACVGLELGPVTLRACGSWSWLDGVQGAPGGEQRLFIVGATVALVRKVYLHLEYVDWTSTADGADDVTLEDGFQAILGWSV